MSGYVVILGTLDTKGKEFEYLKQCIEDVGAKTIVVDTGVMDEPFFKPDITRDYVARCGGSSITTICQNADRGAAIDVMMKGAAQVLKELYLKGEVGGVVSLGGTAGTTIGTYAMRSLPVGVPKLQVSTVASGDTRPYVGTKDIMMMYSVVDIAGLNSISRTIIANAGHAIAAMALYDVELPKEEKPLIAATMFGVTTPCVTKAREYLEDLGYEVLVFHATGAGGQSMEALIEGGFIKGVLDITTTEWADELVG
ncbi:MAG TPA: Tm-1-like ATP-binding domain-containing protein, partial [Clostridia bacterium]